MPTPPPWWTATHAAPRRDVEHRVEDRPVRDGVGAVAHRLGLAVRRGDGAGVQVVAPDHDRRRDLAAAHELVEAQPGAVAVAVADPADARRQPLEGDALAGLVEPALQPRVLGEQLAHGGVGGGDVVGLAGRAPPSGTGRRRGRTAAARRPARSRGSRRRARSRRCGPRCAGCCRSRRRPRRRPGTSTIAAQWRAIEARAALDVAPRGRASRSSAASSSDEAGRDVAAERVVRRRLVGHDVGHHAAGARRPRRPRVASPTTPIERPSPCARASSTSRRAESRSGATRSR